VAHSLKGLGINPDDRVAICTERSLEMIIGILGILKAGGAYVPLDPASPSERLRYMLEDSAPAALLTQAHLQERFGPLPSGLGVLDLDRAFARSSQPESNLEGLCAGLDPEHLAYVIYTSGSTGAPKGVMISHRGVCNQIAALQVQCATSPQDRILQFASITFDASVEEIFSALLSGATLVLRTNDWLAGSQEFWSLVERRAITVVDLPTRFWSQIVEDRVARIPLSLRLLIIGGEAVERKALADWFAGSGYRPPLLNSYGPTEATVNTTLGAISPDSSKWGSIGRPLGNMRTYILDGSGEPAPVGVRGEMYIAGASLSRGYLNRPELTAERFIADRFSPQAGGRMYRTGDIARFLPGGNIEFLGRNDFQIKIRGYRIELGEIDARLGEQAGVAEAVVVALEDGDGQKRLVGYYTEREGWEGKLQAEKLRAGMAEKLPEYMVPAAYVRVQKMPWTVSGKLDREKLPAPDENALAAPRYEAPQSEMEVLLARVWSEVLKVDRAGRNDNFFQRGGHSLLTMRVVHLLAKQNVRVLAVDLFAHPTIASLAAKIEQQSGRMDADIPVCIRKGGGETPLFLVHDGMGELVYAPALSSSIDSGIPVYGLPAASPDQPSLRTIESMAMRMVRMIRQEQPAGPYRLAGWSFGGVLAYEIAAQLIGADEAVEFVGLLDSVYSARAEKPGDADFHDGLLALLQRQAQDQPASSGEEDLQPVISGAEPGAHGVELEILAQEFRKMPLTAGAWDHPTTGQAEQILARIRSYNASLSAYSAQSIPVPIHLFIAEDNVSLPHLGWDTVLPEDQIHAIPVQGTHLSMMADPYIQMLGQTLSEAIRSATESSRVLKATRQS
jgi:amino acid adenylation domain-containing protein